VNGVATDQLRGRRLAVVVSTAPDRGDLDWALDLARVACERDVDVGVFFMDQAVDGLPARVDQLAALAEAGCDLICCGSSAHARGLGPADVGASVLLGSQDDHAALVHRADRVVAFT
jgi:sulfur relay (sulfurtransferase) complex TusBCD TusD component (DsrE family)